MELWGITDSGKIRKQNQDSFRTLLDENKGVAVLIVCDGMGGAKAGNVASALAVDAFIDHMGGCIENIGDSSDTAARLTDAVLAANKAVYEQSIQDEQYEGMGTTLTAAISTKEGEVVANIGDSRVYRITKNSITQITKDHSVVEDMIMRGDLTRAEARRHPNKHLITRALGTSSEESPDVFFTSLDQDDYMLLCSDGLSNVVFDNEILYELQRGASIRESCEGLVEMALSRGAPDNVTAVLFRK
ncbi:MAG: Stp1/IreP family PP2C-type Ser/Thr phosphatase [Oscillospiraceae bacterium]|nr:Stp1/IreP family PP2C-type Ser/Thr phosphatase [Oscillospiraceae bacterium]